MQIWTNIPAAQSVCVVIAESPSLGWPCITHQVNPDTLESDKGRQKHQWDKYKSGQSSTNQDEQCPNSCFHADLECWSFKAEVQVVIQWWIRDEICFCLEFWFGCLCYASGLSASALVLLVAPCPFSSFAWAMETCELQPIRQPNLLEDSSPVHHAACIPSACVRLPLSAAIFYSAYKVMSGSDQNRDFAF